MDAMTVGLVLAALLVGLVVGAVAGALVATQQARLRTARLAAERDLLAQRAAALESAADDDASLAATLAPVTSSMARLERQVQVLERDRAEQYGRLGQQLESVRLSGEALREQTASLAGALRSSTARGTWGEVQLQRVVEHAGMVARVDFDTQVSGTNREGAAVRPDAVVRLPGGKHVVIDAKAPLAAFLEAQAAGGGAAASERRMAAATTEHARALRAHVDALAAKEYWTAFVPSPEIVVCFVPGEALLASACAADPTLLEHAMARRVVLATPTTLLALLRTVALTWQQEALSENAKELLALGRELHGRLCGLGGRTAQLGRTLGKAVEHYNAMVATLESRVLVSARRMTALDLTDEEVPDVVALDALPRPLTAPELLEGAEPRW